MARIRKRKVPTFNGKQGQLPPIVTERKSSAPMAHSNRDVDRAGVNDSGEFSQQYQTVSHAASEVAKGKKGGARSTISEQADNDG